jgi:hypothetical protein
MQGAGNIAGIARFTDLDRNTALHRTLASGINS